MEISEKYEFISLGLLRCFISELLSYVVLKVCDIIVISSIILTSLNIIFQPFGILFF